MSPYERGATCARCRQRIWPIADVPNAWHDASDGRACITGGTHSPA